MSCLTIRHNGLLGKLKSSLDVTRHLAWYWATKPHRDRVSGGWTVNQNILEYYFIQAISTEVISTGVCDALCVQPDLERLMKT
jgi:hypothetical protein